MRLFTTAIALTGTAIVMSQPASAQAQGSFGIRVSVPEVCTVESFDLTLAQETESLVGSLVESCNSSRAYQVFVSHRPLLDRENVTIRYDNVSTRLGADGLASVASRSGARHQAVPVAIESDNLSAPLSISFAIGSI